MRTSIKLQPTSLPEALHPDWSQPVATDATDTADEHPVRGILVGCGVSLAFWLAILIFVL
jgi:hypothetical protein